MKLITLMLVAAVHITHAASTILWDEGVHGDLSDDFEVPSMLTVAAGENLISGIFSASDADLFTIVVPQGLTLTRIQLTSYTHDNSDNLSFFGMQRGATLSSPPSSFFHDEIGYTLFGSWALDGTDLLAILSSYPEVQTPLVEGKYAFWLNETSSSSASGTLSFTAEAIPEPSHFISFVCASVLSLMRRRK
jgi:hypothetical protein